MDAVAHIEVCGTCGELLPNHANDCNDLAAILTDVEAHITRFVSFGSRHRSVAIALWTAHVYAIKTAPSAAYLRIKSAAEESGKTTLLEVLEQILGATASTQSASRRPSCSGSATR